MLSKIKDWFKNLIQRKREVAEVSRLSDRDLRDMGITRWDVLNAINTHRT